MALRVARHTLPARAVDVERRLSNGLTRAVGPELRPTDVESLTDFPIAERANA